MPSSTKRPPHDPTYTVNLEDESGPISVIQFSPYELSQELLLIALPNKILLSRIVFQENIEYEQLAEFKSGSICTSLSFSPETTLATLPPVILFCSAGNDFKLRVFSSNLGNENVCKLLDGHGDYINEISYDPENSFIASVSDDNTAKIWNISDYSCQATLRLTSAGVSVCWHREDASKLMVGEKIGLIRFYNVNTQVPILSLDCGKPLSSAHWAASDSQLVCSLHLGEIVWWDLTQPSRPSHTKLVYSSNGGSLRLNASNELIATVNKLEGSIKVLQVGNQQQRLSETAILPTSATWHFRLPVFCVGDDKELCFWKLSSK